MSSPFSTNFCAVRIICKFHNFIIFLATPRRVIAHYPSHEKSDPYFEEKRRTLELKAPCPDTQVNLLECNGLGRILCIETHSAFWAYGSFTSDMHRVIIDNHVLPFLYDIHGGPGSFCFKIAIADQIELKI